MIDEINHFVNWIRRRNPHAHTCRDYLCDLQQFVKIVGDRPFTDITFRDVDNFINVQIVRGLKAATINRRLAAVMSFFTFLADENPGLICPVRPYRHTLRLEHRLPRSVPAADLKRFFAVIDSPRDHAIFLLMLRCGLRISEVTKLKLRDLSLNETPPRLLVSGKNSKERIVYISDQAIFALQHYLSERPAGACQAVFLNYRGQGLAAIGIHKRLTTYRKAAGIHLTAHQLRHNFANDLVAADMPVTSIQKLMGHAWIATTQLYLDANDPKVKQDFFAATRQMGDW